MAASSPSLYRLQKGSNAQQAQEEVENGADGQGKNMHLEEQLTHEKLMELQKIFEEADEDGGGGLDMDEFRHAMRKAMGEHLTDREMDQIFMKVDTNCDGTVDWDEYLTYMLLEYQEKDIMSFVNQDRYIARSARMVPNKHKDSVVSTLFMPNIIKEPIRNQKEISLIKLDFKHGKFVTVGKDGIISFWTPEMKLLASQKIEPQNQRSSIWITDSTYMANAHTLVLSTTSREILFYDVNVGKFTFMSKVTELEVCATCLHFSGTPGNPAYRILVWGDSKGCAGALVFSTCPQYSPFHISSGNSHRTRLSFAELIRGTVPTVKAYYHQGIHDDFVRQIRYYRELECFISCCRSSATSMHMGDPIGNRENTYYLVHKGINCFEYSSHMNVIITGGYDAIVRVWNPYVPSKPIILLQGHKSPVIFVTINVERELVVSISEAREIMVHEMATQKCMQTIFRKMVPVGPRPISSVCVNHCRQSLIVSSNKMAFFRHDPQHAEDSNVVYSHQNTVTAALYNPLFEQVVSIGDDSLVCVWDIHTGSREMQFAAHKVWEHCEEVPREITAMAFGPTYRRLFTAGRDNFMKIWNFNNGACLRQIDITKHGEVTNIICQKNKIVLAGWSGILEVHVDDPDDDTIERFTKQHRDDILSVDYYPPFLVASSDYEGKIYLWSLETGRVLYLLCANRGAGPVSPGSGIGLNVSMSNARSKFSSRRRNINKNHSSKAKENRGQNHLPDVKLTRTYSCAVDCMNEIKVNETSVDKLLFLTHRESDKKTATLVASGADSWVRAWSTHPEGGLLGQFMTCYNVGRHILAMVSDSVNEYLITGDDHGYIKVWDITEYCLKGINETPMKKKMESAKYKKFIFVQQSETLTRHSQQGAACPLAPVSSKPKETVRTPPLLNSFQGHLSAITSVDYVDSMKLIVSASTDCSIRLWTIYGNFVGIFGQKDTWHIPNLTGPSLFATFPGLNKSRAPPPIPADIRRVASVGTLRVLKHGVTRGWKLARDVLRWIGTFSKTDQDKKPVEESPKESVSITRSSNLDVNKADILGKWYKPFMKHKQLPKIQPPSHFGTKVSVFSSLSVHELKQLDKVEPPQSILDIQARQQLMTNAKGRNTKLNDITKGRRFTKRHDRHRSFSLSQGNVKGRSSSGVVSEKMEKTSRELSQLGVAPSVDSADKSGNSGDAGHRCSLSGSIQNPSIATTNKANSKSLAPISEQ